MPYELTQNVIQPEIEEETTVDLPYRVILYNDDVHTFDEVIHQLIKALKCSFEEAKSYAFEVHIKGKAKIFEGELSECLRVTSILEEIELHTQIIA
ncbi:ATP-dependent Clp protease adaptor ClpS [Melioribacter sp. OK-6-Me]|uniref:ATP-dependent Clp protease adaptor ClpS n=1 Tax=unclassified Melioribacter TaxID=2627329 RepID=UPI003EDA8305